MAVVTITPEALRQAERLPASIQGRIRKITLRLAKVDRELPMPSRNARGNYPAAEALQVSIARSILRERRAAGLTQIELARRAGIRAETLNRIENGKHVPSVATIEKIEKALANSNR